MNTPPSSPIKKSQKVNSPNAYSSPSRSENLIISPNRGEYSLKHDFIHYLVQHIPILLHPILYDLVIKYCLILNGKYGRKADVYIVLNEIKDCLGVIKTNSSTRKINKNTNLTIRQTIEKHHPATSELFELYILSNDKIIKSHKIIPDALIETFINCIVYYCSNSKVIRSNSARIGSNSEDIGSNSARIGSITNSWLNYSANNKLYQKMNIAPGMELGEFVTMLYSSDLNIKEKNDTLLTLLKSIAFKLNELQNSCGFIHGDLNIGNVFVKYDDNNENALPEITFIDFGYSSVRLLLQNNSYLIVTAPTEINIKRETPFDILEEPELRAVDMYHLIDDLSFIESSNFKKNYENFKNFIQDIKSLYGGSVLTKQHKNQDYSNITQDRRKYTSSKYYILELKYTSFNWALY